ncbi:MAG: cytochrome c3 family protein [Phycisphaerae bacterium]
MSLWERRLGARAADLVLAAVILGTATFTAAANRSGLIDPVRRLQHGPGVANHPVNVVPSSAVRVPENWPLAPDGSITCLTCHGSLTALSGAGGPQLRDFDEADGGRLAFCARCHDASAKRTASGMHWMVVGAAHIKPQRRHSAGSTGMLDHASRRCMECHDGVTASETSTGTAWFRGAGSMGDPRRNHPVDVDYPTGFTKKGAGPFKPSSVLPPEIRLPAGQVGCISCHDLYKPDRNKLSVTMEGSRLCFTCHDMD